MKHSASLYTREYKYHDPIQFAQDQGGGGGEEAYNILCMYDYVYTVKLYLYNDVCMRAVCIYGRYLNLVYNNIMYYHRARMYNTPATCTYIEVYFFFYLQMKNHILCSGVFPVKRRFAGNILIFRRCLQNRPQ